MGRMIVTESYRDEVLEDILSNFEKEAKDRGVRDEDVPKIKEAVAKSVPKADDYMTRLMKSIPTEIVAAYLFIDGIIRSMFTDQVTSQVWLWIIFGVLLVATPLYLKRVTKVTDKGQLFFSFIAFAVWVFAIGGAFAQLSWYRPGYGSIAIVLSVIFIAIYKGESSK